MTDDAAARLERVMSAGFNTLADLIRETNSRLDIHEKVLVQLVGEVTSLKGEVTSLKGEVTSLKGEVRSLNVRFDNFLTGAHRQAHEELAARVGKLEDAVFRRAG